MDCIFCKIAKKTIPSTIVYEDDALVAFNDIHPRAPTHQLIIPKKHIATVNDVCLEDAGLIGQMVLVAKKLAKESAHAENGYRLVFNCNAAGGQEVYHLHLHLLAGRQMTWPPG
jgi:histidine triad (HIT) family protein